MDTVQRGILMLIRSGLTGQGQKLPEDFHLEEAEQLIIDHQIVGLVYEGAILCDISRDDPVMGRLFQRYCQLTHTSNLQCKAVDALLAAFGAAGIDHMPIKGHILKPLYPKPAMRVMADADILIRMEQYDKIQHILKEKGYRKQREEDHTITWNSPDLELELHKRLVPRVDEDYYNYLGDGWQRAKEQEGHRYAMSTEDTFLFLLIHFTKHYRNRGIGLRQAVDLWVYTCHYPDMDVGYLTQELEKLKLDKFWANLQDMLQAWFADAPFTEKTAFITEYIFRSGSWGTEARKGLFRQRFNIQKTGSAQKGKRRQILRAMFPDAEAMACWYPILRKCSWLLPVMWPVRWASVLLFHTDRVKAHMQLADQQQIQRVEAFTQELAYVGLE